MSARLSDEQRQALAQQPDQPLCVEDPQTAREYVLISREAFERMQQAVSYDDSEVSPEEVSLLVDQVMATDDTDDPTLDSYQDLPEEPGGV